MSDGEPAHAAGQTSDVDEPGVEEVSERLGNFADMAERVGMSLYHRLAKGASADAEVAGRLVLAHRDQRHAPLLLAAVHDVLLGGDDHPLRAWYPSVVPDARPVGVGDEDPWPHFRDLVLDHPGVEANLRGRSTQTNEVGRCTALLPALADVAANAPGAPPDGTRPLGLVEAGASAGLNLLLGRYDYHYAPAPDHHRNDDVHVIDGDSPVILECQLRGPLRPPLPAEAPNIASAIGIDLHPVDLGDRRQSRWLVACQWPEQPERLHRLRAAIALAHGDPPHVVEGDAVDGLASAVATVPGFALPVVLAAWSMAYLSEARQRAFLAELDRIGAGRELTFLLADQPDLVPGLPVPPRPDGNEARHPTALVRIDWRNGQRQRPVLLADLHPHGTWLEWLDDPTGH